MPDPQPAKATAAIPSLAEVCQSPDDFLGNLDIAALNLICATGLPGAEDLDIAACLDKIDEWADKVRHATSRNFGLFLDQPELFDGSLGKFYMAVLCTTLQLDCGVGYSPERAAVPGDARNSQDRFVHGITHGIGGTCASLPVLCAAVGRRVGYPLKIVLGARHLFLRWDESDRKTSLVTDRFNIEATARGFVSHPDEKYLLWPFTHPGAASNPCEFLRSMTPREELALFLGLRSVVLMDNGRFAEAIEPAALARAMDPDDYGKQSHLEIVVLAALGILGEQPDWVGEQPVVRADGTTWNRHWWPRQFENPELLAAAKLPPFVLKRILPPVSAETPVGALADQLYERASVYADEAKSLHLFHEFAIQDQVTAEALRVNDVTHHQTLYRQMPVRRGPRKLAPAITRLMTQPARIPQILSHPML